MSVCLINVHLTGVYLMSMHVTDVHLISVHFIGVYLMACTSRWSICRDLGCKIRVFALVAGWSLLRAAEPCG
jgi:hypothetical protein